jgi:putative oxidoreductase
VTFGSDVALLALRVTIGAIFAAHGLQKAFGWWGGIGWEGWKGAIGGMGLRPILFWTAISVLAELAGIALILGLLVPLAAAGLVAQGIVIIKKVHLAKGFWNAKGGIEFPLALLGGTFAVQVLGPGSWSLDAVLPVGFLYVRAVSWIILGLAVAGGMVAAFLPPPAAPAAPSP